AVRLAWSSSLSLHDALPISGAICHVRMVLALFLKVIQRTAALAENIFLPGVELGSEIFPLARIHERLIVSGPVFNHFCNRRHQQDRKSTRLNSSHVKISYAV